MKILVVTSGLHKEYGGPPMAVVGISCAMSKLRHDVSIVVFGQSNSSYKHNSSFYDALKENRVKTHVAKSKKTRIYGGLGNIRDLKYVVNEIKTAEVVSIHGIYNLQNLLIVPILKIYKKPMAIMPHGTLTNYQRSIHRKRKKLVEFYFENILLKSARKIFVATNSEKKQITKKLQHKTRIVGLGISNNNTIQSRIFKESDTFTFLYIGRLAKKKRLDIAIESFALLKKKSERKIKFVVCGSGDQSYTQYLTEYSQNLGLGDSIEFRGWVDGDDKSKVLSESNCFILTSEDENFAIAVAEALSNGLPCVISRKVALSALISKYSAGIVFENVNRDEIINAMNEILSSNLMFMHKSALNASKELTWDKVVNSWIFELTKMLDESK